VSDYVLTISFSPLEVIAVKAGEAARKGLALTAMTSKGLKSRRIGTEKKQKN